MLPEHAFVQNLIYITSDCCDIHSHVQEELIKTTSKDIKQKNTQKTQMC